MKQKYRNKVIVKEQIGRNELLKNVLQLLRVFYKLYDWAEFPFGSIYSGYKKSKRTI